MHVKANAPAVAYSGKTVIGFNWIGGKEVEGDLPSFDARSAVDSRDTVGIFPECGARDLDRAAWAAAAALGSWSGLPLPARGDLIGRVGEVLAAHSDQVAAVITREVGRTPREARDEVRETVGLCRRFQDAGPHLKGAFALAGRTGGHSHRRPLGVCAVLAGASSPLAAPAWKIMAALLCGDTVVWKPSVNAPTTAYLLVRAMMDAGLPPGVVNVVNGRGRGELGRALGSGLGKGLFQKVCFCGSPAVGRALGELAGRALVPCSLELEGRNPMVVLPDAPVAAAAEAALRGAFGAAGQRRASLRNLIVHQDVAGAFREAFLAGVARLTVGNPVTNPEVDLGPIVNARCAKDFETHWAMGREDGARLLCGGAAWTEANRTAQVLGPIAKGSYAQPCVWDEVAPEMRLFKGEVFGPSVNLVTVAGFDQALACANQSPHAAVAVLLTRDRACAGRFLQENNAGVCLVNEPGQDWTGNGDAERGAGWEAEYPAGARSWGTRAKRRPPRPRRRPRTNLPAGTGSDGTVD